MIHRIRTCIPAPLQRALAKAGNADASVRGVGWMTIAEIANRFSRIVTAVALARAFSLPEFAAMSLVLTAYELIRMFIHNGLGARLVGAREGELNEVCEAVNRINWIAGAAMCALQILIAYPLQYFYQSNIAAALIGLAAVHLIYPFAMTRWGLALRRERFGFVAGTQFLQLTGDNLLTAGMALAGLGVWAVVVPKIVIAIIFVAITLRFIKGWRRAPASKKVLREVLKYSRYVFFAEALNTLRNNGDRMIVGKVLGADLFALYAFASNAGAGIATGLSMALGQVALPFLAKGSTETSDVRKRFWLTIKAMYLVIGPIILLQATLAPVYVPLVFGERWRPAIPLLIVMSLGALTRPLAVATSQMLRATGAVSLEFSISQWSALTFFGALFAGLPFGVMGIAVATFVATAASTIFFAWISLRAIDNRSWASRRDFPLAKEPV